MSLSGAVSLLSQPYHPLRIAAVYDLRNVFCRDPGTCGATEAQLLTSAEVRPMSS